MYKDSDMSVQSTDSLPSEDSEYDELETSLAAEQSSREAYEDSRYLRVDFYFLLFRNFGSLDQEK